MRCFVLGDISVDLIYFLEHIPEPGEEVEAKRALMKPGGGWGYPGRPARQPGA